MNGKIVDLKALYCAVRERKSIKALILEVDDSSAPGADQVVVASYISVKSGGARVVKSPDQPQFGKGIEHPVNGGPG